MLYSPLDDIVMSTPSQATRFFRLPFIPTFALFYSVLRRVPSHISLAVYQLKTRNGARDEVL
jgi:hypothetical protein